MFYTKTGICDAITMSVDDGQREKILPQRQFGRQRRYRSSCSSDSCSQNNRSVKYWTTTLRVIRQRWSHKNSKGNLILIECKGYWGVPFFCIPFSCEIHFRTPHRPNLQLPKEKIQWNYLAVPDLLADQFHDQCRQTFCLHLKWTKLRN